MFIFTKKYKLLRDFMKCFDREQKSINQKSMIVKRRPDSAIHVNRLKQPKGESPLPERKSVGMV